ncbi:terminase [Enterobacter hormaechei]|uniref:terminase n=1 Tax=Enterobacter hormaechei TaxID=158836 RepID=UPI00115D4942|nr:terminase [Enterobacter hormaechei]
MSGARKLKCVTTDPRWREMAVKYRYDYARAVVELFGMMPSPQQQEIIESVQGVGSRTTVTSGHGTGKSSLTAMLLLIYMILYPDARVVIVANKIAQVKTGVFKYVKTYWANAIKRHGWLQNYFVLSDTMFYERSRKGIWEVLCKGYRLGNEEALAGEHAAHLLLILDEASGISDKAIGVMTGALTELDNRMLMLSQPTRPSGYFYDSHHTLAKNPENPNGIWTSIVLNSEESPFVTTGFIKQKLMEYGGRDSLEYMVKVLGQFPREIAGYLLGRDECDRAARRRVFLERGWGWVATADVGNGRDKSVLNIQRVSGHREKRRVVNFKILEMPGTMDPLAFGDFIYNECTPDKYPNITIAVDADGFGSDTCAQLVRRGANPVRIRWGKPMFAQKDKDRFVNQRAYANIMARDAIKSGRMRIDAGPKTAEQASKIPYMMNEEGRLVMMRKEHMRQKLNIKSPDRWDTYCFTFIVDYVPADEDAGGEMEAFREEALSGMDVVELDL